MKFPWRFWFDQAGLLLFVAMLSGVSSDFVGSNIIQFITAAVLPHDHRAAGELTLTLGQLAGFSAIAISLVGAILIPLELCNYPLPYKRKRDYSAAAQYIWRRNLLIVIAVLTWFFIASLYAVFKTMT